MLMRDRRRTAVPTAFDLKQRSLYSYRHIMTELMQLHAQALFSPETLIAVIAVLTRFRQRIPLTTHNLIRVLQVSVALSVKSVDDVCAGLGAFSYREALVDLIELEREFCQVVDYRLNVDRDAYALCYQIYDGLPSEV